MAKHIVENTIFISDDFLAEFVLTVGDEPARTFELSAESTEGKSPDETRQLREKLEEARHDKSGRNYQTNVVLPKFRRLASEPPFREVQWDPRVSYEDDDSFYTIYMGVNNDPEWDPEDWVLGTPQPKKQYRQDYTQWGSDRVPIGHRETLVEPPKRPPWLNAYPQYIRNYKGELQSFYMRNPAKETGSFGNLHESMALVHLQEGESVADFQEWMECRLGRHRAGSNSSNSDDLKALGLATPNDFGKVFKVVPSTPENSRPVVIEMACRVDSYRNQFAAVPKRLLAWNPRYHEYCPVSYRLVVDGAMKKGKKGSELLGAGALGQCLQHRTSMYDGEHELMWKTCLQATNHSLMACEMLRQVMMSPMYKLLPGPHHAQSPAVMEMGVSPIHKATFISRSMVPQRQQENGLPHGYVDLGQLTESEANLARNDYFRSIGPTRGELVIVYKRLSGVTDKILGQLVMLTGASNGLFFGVSCINATKEDWIDDNIGDTVFVDHKALWFPTLVQAAAWWAGTHLDYTGQDGVIATVLPGHEWQGHLVLIRGTNNGCSVNTPVVEEVQVQRLVLPGINGVVPEGGQARTKTLELLCLQECTVNSTLRGGVYLEQLAASDVVEEANIHRRFLRAHMRYRTGGTWFSPHTGMIWSNGNLPTDEQDRLNHPLHGRHRKPEKDKDGHEVNEEYVLEWRVSDSAGFVDAQFARMRGQEGYGLYDQTRPSPVHPHLHMPYQWPPAPPAPPRLRRPPSQWDSHSPPVPAPRLQVRVGPQNNDENGDAEVANAGAFVAAGEEATNEDAGTTVGGRTVEENNSDGAWLGYAAAAAAAAPAPRDEEYPKEDEPMRGRKESVRGGAFIEDDRKRPAQPIDKPGKTRNVRAKSGEATEPGQHREDSNLPSQRDQQPIGNYTAPHLSNMFNPAPPGAAATTGNASGGSGATSSFGNQVTAPAAQKTAGWGMPTRVEPGSTFQSRVAANRKEGEKVDRGTADTNTIQDDNANESEGREEVVGAEEATSVRPVIRGGHTWAENSYHGHVPAPSSWHEQWEDRRVARFSLSSARPIGSPYGSDYRGSRVVGADYGGRVQQLVGLQDRIGNSPPEHAFGRRSAAARVGSRDDWMFRFYGRADHPDDDENDHGY